MTASPEFVISGGFDEHTIVLGPHRVRLHQPDASEKWRLRERASEAQELSTAEHTSYWAMLWPAATPLARAILDAPWPVGSSVLELGCGIGLSGLAAMLRGDKVTYSDVSADAVAYAIENARLNGCAAEALRFDWAKPPDRKFDVLVASDVLYDVEQIEALLHCISQTMEVSGQCWIGDPGRPPLRRFFEMAGHAGFDTELVDEQGTAVSFPMLGRFQILKLRRSSPPGASGDAV